MSLLAPQKSATPPRAEATGFDKIGRCLAFLHAINVTELDTASQSLQQLLEGMLVARLPPLEHLRVLEEARASLDHVQGELARRYASRPLPPSSAEERVLQGVVRGWDLMGAGYARLAQETLPAGDATAQIPPALIVHRRIGYQALAIAEYFRARREVPGQLWLDLHALFLFAERFELSLIRVPDPLNETWGMQSPFEAYAALLLVDIAGPYGRTPREFQWIVRWAQRFARYCSLTEASAALEPGNYVLDPARDHGLRPAGENPVPDQRCFVTTRVAAYIRKIVSELKSGVPAHTLGLGEDCAQPACGRLLVSLYRPWGLASGGRKFQRTPTQGYSLQICTDPAGVAFFLTGGRFEEPEAARARYGSIARSEALLTLNERVEQVPLSDAQLTERAQESGYVLETWEVLDQSLTGFRLSRRRGESRIEHRQLAGVRVGEQQGRMLLAEVSWLQFSRAGELGCGIALMPGPPTPVLLRPADGLSAGKPQGFRLGFLLPGVPALKIEPSLILPAGWYQAERLFELGEEHSWHARARKLVSRGANFDRVEFRRDDAPA